MKTLLAELPDSKEDLVPWLEPILVSGKLRQLVSELSVVSTHGKPADLNTLLGGKLDEAMQQGLDEVAESDLQGLFRHPFSLMELQKTILEQGSEYWLQLVNQNNRFPNETAIREHLASIVNRPRETARSQKAVDNMEAVETRPATPDASSSRPGWLAMAAGLLLALTMGFFAYTNWPTVETQTAWGWQADTQQSLAELSQTEYLNKLARGADTWFNKRPSSIEAVQQRILEFKAGCESLIAADHEPLDEKTRSWLVDRLKTCLADVESSLAGLDDSQVDPIRIRTSVDEIIRGVADDLRGRAG